MDLYGGRGLDTGKAMNDEMAKKESWTPLLKNFPQSRKLNAVSMGAENLFLRLLARCDDHSNYYGDAKIVCARVFSDRWANGEVSVDDVAGWLKELASKELVAFYKDNGDRFLHVVNNKKMLRKDIKEDLRFPPVSEEISERYRSDNGASSSSSSTSSPTQPEPQEYSSDFESFWKKYKRKINKRAAHAKYKARRKEGYSAEQLGKCLAGYNRSIEQEKTPIKFIMHATTFLSRDHRFLDYEDVQGAHDDYMSLKTLKWNYWDMSVEHIKEALRDPYVTLKRLRELLEMEREPEESIAQAVEFVRKARE